MPGKKIRRQKLVQSFDGSTLVKNPSDRKIAGVYWRWEGNAATAAKALNIRHKSLQHRVRNTPALKRLSLKAHEEFGDPRKDVHHPKDPAAPTNAQILKTFEESKGREIGTAHRLGVSRSFVRKRLTLQADLLPHYNAHLKKNAKNRAKLKFVKSDMADASDGAICREARIALLELVKDRHMGAVKLALQALDPSFMPKIEVKHIDDNSELIMGAIARRYGNPKVLKPVD